MNGVTRMESVSDAERNDILSSIGRFCSKHRTLLIIFVIAIVFRLILSWFVTSADTIGFIEVMQNLEAGKDLYQIEGYWYTPVFGYVMSFMDMIADALGCTPVHSVVVPEFIPTGFGNLPEPAYNFIIKIPMIIGDVLVAVILYSLVKEYVDERTALIATGLWLLSPIVWLMSAEQGQFDALCIGFFLISFLMLRKDRCLLAGVFLALSVWMKIFPVLCGLFFLYYIYRKFEVKEEMKRNMFLFLGGIIVTTALVFLPQIINGELPEAFLFLTSRLEAIAGGNTENSMATLRMLFMGLVAIAIIYLLSKRFFSCNRESMEKKLFIYSVFMIACGASIYMSYQYVPCWIFCIVVMIAMVPEHKKVFYIIFAFLSIFPFLEGASHLGPMHFAILSKYYGVFDPQVLADQFMNMTANMYYLNYAIIIIWQIVALLAILVILSYLAWPDKLKKVLGVLRIE